MSADDFVEVAEQLKVDGHEDYEVVLLQGEVDAHTFDEFEDQVAEVVDDNEKIIFNCQDLVYINSAGVGLLLSISSDAEDIIFSRFNDEVRDTLEMLGFLDLFQIEDFSFYGEKVEEMNLSISAETKNLQEVREEIQELLSKYQDDRSEIYKVITALGETLSNIIEHSLDFDPDSQIEIIMEIFERGVIFTIRNDGPEFDPEESEQDLEEFVNNNRRRGLGLYIVHSLLDRVEYNVSAGGDNCVQLEKTF